MRDPARLYGLIALTGLAMGVRNTAVRKLAERDLTTTVLTLTITRLATDSSLAGGGKSGVGEARGVGRADVRGGCGRRVAAARISRSLHGPGGDPAGGGGSP